MGGSYQCETCNALDTGPSFLLENCIRLTTQKHLLSCGLYRVARGRGDKTPLGRFKLWLQKEQREKGCQLCPS